MCRNDWWLPCGIAGFIAGLFSRKISGSTEYQHWIMEVYTCAICTCAIYYTYIHVHVCIAH